MHTDYLSPPIRPLRDQQRRFAPCAFAGKEVPHDSPLLAADLSGAANVPALTAGERVLTVDELARQFRVSTTTVSRWRRRGLVSQRFVFDGRKRIGFLQSSVDRFVALHAACVERVMALPLDYIGNEEFADAHSEKKILAPPPESTVSTKKPRVPSGVPPYLASLYDVPLLTREQEMHLFRRMNYLKYKASTLRAQLDVNRPKRRLIEQIEKLYDESVASKNLIIRANLRLVVSIAKRYFAPTVDFFELVSDGNISLIKAVDKFDIARGNKFSTYATWAIMKNYSRSIADAFRRRDRFGNSDPEIFNTVADVRADHYQQESAQIQRESQVQGILQRLDQRERQIVTSRFGLTRGQEPLTLQQVGAAMGVTKERVRQLQCRAMTKLRVAAEEDRIEWPK
jgi:RNA polymerase primary sigma factor/RNA polymerase sigma factor